MDLGSILYLGVTIGLFIVFGWIFFRTYSRKNKTKNEEAKYRMLDDD